MAIKKTFGDNVAEQSATLGTGNYILISAISGYMTFASQYSTGDTPYYAVRNYNKTKFKYNRGATLFTESDPPTLTRNVWLSSEANGPVDWQTTDLPLIVYVPTAAEVLEATVSGWLSATRSSILKFGTWWRENTWPDIHQHNVFNGTNDVQVGYINTANHGYVSTPVALISNSSAQIGFPPNGYIGMWTGGPVNSGYMAIHKANGDRLGYIGYFNDQINYNAEGTSWHDFKINGVTSVIINGTGLGLGVSPVFRLDAWSNVNGTMNGLRLRNDNTGGSSLTVLAQEAGTAIVNRYVSQGGNYLHKIGTPERYSDFDHHHFRKSNGTDIVQIFTAGNERVWVRGNTDTTPENITAVYANNLTQGVGTYYCGIRQLSTFADLPFYIDAKGAGSVAIGYNCTGDTILGHSPSQSATATQVVTANWVKTLLASGASISAGDIPPAVPVPNMLWWNSSVNANGGQLYISYNDGNTTQWVPAAAPAAPLSQVVPPGAIMDYAGVAAPGGWLICDGTSYAVSAYPNLHAAILYTYGGSGSNFNVPDLRGRVTAGPDGGQGRLNITNNNTIGSAGGAGTVSLTEANLGAHTHTGPVHYHTVPAHGHTGSGAGLVGNNLVNGTPRAVGTGDGTNSGYYQDVTVTINNQPAFDTGNNSSAATGSAGSGTAHNNTQATMVLNKIIKV